MRTTNLPQWLGQNFILQEPLLLTCFWMACKCPTSYFYLILFSLTHLHQVELAIPPYDPCAPQGEVVSSYLRCTLGHGLLWGTSFSHL